MVGAPMPVATVDHHGYHRWRKYDVGRTSNRLNGTPIDSVSEAPPMKLGPDGKFWLRVAATNTTHPVAHNWINLPGAFNVHNLASHS